MTDVYTLSIIATTFLLAGFVKGVIGLGLPSITLALLTATIGLTQAMALLLVPSLVTNLWQACVGGHSRTLIRRLWPFFLLATLSIWIGAYVLAWGYLGYLSALLGVLLSCYAALSLLGVKIQLSLKQQSWSAPLFGIVNGLLTGMTGSFVVPGVLFLQAVGLSRDALVQAMGILFSLSTIALAVALQRQNLLTQELGVLSTVGLIPAILGMWIGQRLRKRLSEQLFRRVFFIALLVLGIYVVLRALGHE